MQILETLLTEESTVYIDNYLIKIHNSTDDFNYESPNFYDERILKLLAEHLINNLNSRHKHLIVNLIQNYAKYNVYNEKLLKFI